MSIGFGDDFKEQVRAHTNLVDLVTETVSLTPTRGGTDYIGLCPFHDDKNPSFHVYPDRQSYRCWVCDEGGDIFRWLMEIEKVSFPEAIEILARRANLEMPERSKYRKDKTDKKTTSYDIVEWAVDQMQKCLASSVPDGLVQKYIQQRGLSQETVTKFRMGYHPEDWSWLINKAHGRFTPQQLVEVGLAGERDNGQGFFDNLVGRLIFPIIDERGRAVAFGGRVLPGSNIDSPAKYWNSPESPVFLKRKTLYAFDHARESIRKQKTAIVVEGYMDCIACHQAGVTNVVATLGTALTEDHVRFLKRFADQVVLTYDGDDAGQKAAERSIERFLASDLDLRVLSLQDKMDPADYLEKYSREEFQQLVESAPEAWAYKLQIVSDRYGLDTVSGRQQVINQLVEFLAAAPGLKDTVRESLILQQLCQAVQIEEKLVRRQLGDTRQEKAKRESFRKVNQERREQEQNSPVQIADPNEAQDFVFEETFAAAAPRESPPAIGPTGATDLAEREVLEIILTEPKLTDYIRHRVGPDDFQHPSHRRLLEICLDLWVEEEILPDAQRVMAATNSDSGLLSLLNALLDSARDKNITALLNDMDAGQSGPGGEVPPHLECVLRPLILRRAKFQKMLSKQQMAQTDSSSSKTLSDKFEALRRIEQLRKFEMEDRPSRED